MSRTPLYHRIIQAIETKEDWVSVNDIAAEIFPGVFTYGSEKMRKQFYRKVLNNIGHAHKHVRDRGHEIQVKAIDNIRYYFIHPEDRSAATLYDELMKLRRLVEEQRQIIESHKQEMDEEEQALNDLINHNQPLLFTVEE